MSSNETTRVKTVNHVIWSFVFGVVFVIACWDVVRLFVCLVACCLFVLDMLWCLEGFFLGGDTHNHESVATQLKKNMNKKPMNQFG